MADYMNFPKRWEDFLNDYEFEDSRRIYTNGSWLIPSFRVKQMMEHYLPADVEPVRHAHWEYWDGWMSNHDMRIKCVCSACGYKDVVRGYGYDNIKHLPERCHGCWAKMDERKDK